MADEKKSPSKPKEEKERPKPKPSVVPEKPPTNELAHIPSNLYDTVIGLVPYFVWGVWILFFGGMFAAKIICFRNRH